MSRLPKILGLFIYFFVLITSFYHVFKFYEIFETEQEGFVAFFVAVGFELSVLYFAYIATKYKFTASKVALGLSLFIVWFSNVFVMARNVYAKTFEIAFLNDSTAKIILALIGSIFLPVGSFFLGKIIANLDVLRENAAKPIPDIVPTPIEASESIVEAPTVTETACEVGINIETKEEEPFIDKVAYEKPQSKLKTKILDLMRL